MFKHTINVIIATLAMSLLFAGCANQNKKVKLPIRQVGTKGKAKTCDLKKDPKCKEADEGAGFNIPTTDTEQKAKYEAADKDLIINESERVKLKDLPAGTYKLESLDSQFIVNAGTDVEASEFGMISSFGRHKDDKGSEYLGNEKRQAEAVVHFGSSDKIQDIGASLNFLVDFELKIEGAEAKITNSVAMSILMKSNVLPTRIASLDQIRGFSAGLGASNMDLVIKSDEGMEGTVFTSKALDRTGLREAVIKQLGDSKYMVKVTIYKDNAKLISHNLYAVYNVTKTVSSPESAAEAGADAGGDGTEQQQAAGADESDPLAGAVLN